jgi:hypothetical protein
MSGTTGDRRQETGDRKVRIRLSCFVSCSVSCLLSPVSCLLFLLCLTACPAKPPLVRPYPPPAAAELAAGLAARQAGVRSMNARARATSWLGGERVRATVLMLATRAGSLRFEAEVSLQGTVASLTSDAGRFELLDLHKNELARGPACPANVASLVRIPLEPREVAAILLGDVAIDAAAAGAGSVSWDGARGADVLAVAMPSGTLRLAFQGDAAHRILIGLSRDDAAGRRLWQAAYEDFATEGSVAMPTTIRFAEGTQSYDDGVEIKFKDRTLNTAARPTDFTIAPPAGATVKDVGCGAANSR